jgi:hypothetical protein
MLTLDTIVGLLAIGPGAVSGWYAYRANKLCSTAGYPAKLVPFYWRKRSSFSEEGWRLRCRAVRWGEAAGACILVAFAIKHLGT